MQKFIYISLSVIEFSEYILQNATVFEVLHFRFSVQSGLCHEFLSCICLHLNLLSHLQVSSVHLEAESLSAIETKRVSTLALEELHWQDAHAHKVAPVDSFVAHCNDCLDALEIGTLGCPISGGT